jgi:DNA-binding beta-propeller fold protein YncE
MFSFDVYNRLFVAVFCVIGYSFSLQADTAPHAYVATQGQSSLSVIDIINPPPQPISAPIIPLSQNPKGIVITPDQSQACVLNETPLVSIVDLDTQAFVEVALPSIGNSITVTPDGTKAVVNADGAFVIIDLATKQVTHVPVSGVGVCGVAVAPDSLSAYGLYYDSDHYVVYRIGLMDQAVLATIVIPTSIAPNIVVNLTLSPNGEFLCLAGSEELIIIDTTAYSLTRVPLIYGTYGIAITPDSSKVCAGSNLGHFLYVIDLVNAQLLQEFDLGGPDGSVYGVSITPDGSRVCVASNGDGITPNSGRVTIVDINSGQTGVVMMGMFPSMVAITPTGKQAVITEYLPSPNGTTYILDLESLSVTSVSVGADPWFLAIRYIAVLLKPENFHDITLSNVI